jgi:hypothetical protein
VDNKRYWKSSSILQAKNVDGIVATTNNFISRCSIIVSEGFLSLGFLGVPSSVPPLSLFLI